MIEAVYLTFEDHVNLQTQVYRFKDTTLERVSDYAFNTKVRHIYIKVSETQSCIWLLPTSTHPPESWETIKLRWIFEGSTEVIESRKDWIPVNTYLYINKERFNSLGLQFYLFSSAPNCKVVPHRKPPRREPPATLRDKHEFIVPDESSRVYTQKKPRMIVRKENYSNKVI
jgi:hypothetical protein